MIMEVKQDNMGKWIVSKIDKDGNVWWSVTGEKKYVKLAVKKHSDKIQKYVLVFNDKIISSKDPVKFLSFFECI